MLQSALNRFRTRYSVFLDKKWKALAERTPRQNAGKTEATAEYLEYKLEAFGTDDAIHLKGRYATQCIACESPEGFQGSSIVRFECATDTCKHCTSYPRPSAEEKVTRIHDFPFHCYKVLQTCIVGVVL